MAPSTQDRLEHLCTQLQWRLTEYGECWYEIGVTDLGKPLGTDHKTFDRSILTLERMCERVGAEIASVDRFSVADGRVVAEVLIRPTGRSRSADSALKSIDNGTKEIRIAFAGDSNSGKSTLIGVLAYGNLDNGRGDVRLSLLRHRHEILSGRTSSVAVEPLVLRPDSAGHLTPYRFDTIESTDYLTLGNQRAMLEAPKVLQFFDLPGKPKFHRSALTTFSSLAGPDLVCLVTAAGTGVSHLDEYISMLEVLEIPFIIVVSKTDTCSEYCAEDSLSNKRVFPVSAITGDGVPELLQFLSNIEPVKQRPLFSTLPVFAVESVKATEDVGIVLKGAVISGALELNGNNQDWLLGPTASGTWNPVTLKSAHRLRLPVHSVPEGLMAAVAISGETPLALRGMVLAREPLKCVSMNLRWTGWRLITGKAPDKEIQGTLHCGSARVLVKAVLADEDVILIDSGDQTMLLVPGIKLILVTSNCIIAGRMKT